MAEPLSYLYVPGDRPDLQAKAVRHPAHALVLDLEDAVAAGAKQAALDTVRRTLLHRPAPPVPTWVRIEPAVAPRQLDTLPLAALAGIVLPKATPEALESVAELLHGRERACGLPAGSVGVIPLLESAAGILDARAIATHPRTRRLGIGEVDLAADLGIAPDPGTDPSGAWAAIRVQLVLAAAATGIPAPIAPVHRRVSDVEGLRRSCAAFAALGFGARTVLSPRQVPVVNASFGPAADRVAWARRVLDVAGEASRSGVAVTPDGEMVDVAVVRQAARVLGAGPARNQEKGQS